MAATAGTSRELRRTRLAPAKREAMILDEAIAFFAEHGFGGQLRDLARRAGISQGLIFRYFGSKKALVESVYERVYVARWSSQWQLGLRDRGQSLERRLINFYRSYLSAIDGYEWIRVTLFSGLGNNDLTRRYLETRVDSLLAIIASELQHALPHARQIDPTLLRELVWHLHSTFIYYLVRKYVFQVQAHADTGALTEVVVTNFMAGFQADATDTPTPQLQGDEASRGKC